jgi:restriction system protein
MARKKSGWTVVKAIARDIERANRLSQKAAAINQRALLREQERIDREEQKIIQKLSRDTKSIQDKINRAINTATESNNIAIKLKKIDEIREQILNLETIQETHPHIDLTIKGARSIHETIARIQEEADQLISEQQQQDSLEKNAISNTLHAQRIRNDIQNLLKYTLSIDDAIDWNKIKDTQEYLISEPIKPLRVDLPEEPNARQFPARPDRSSFKYNPSIPLHFHLFKKKKKALIEESQRSYECDIVKWEDECRKIKSKNKKDFKDWDNKKRELIDYYDGQYQSLWAAWNKEKQEHYANQEQYNQDIDILRHKYQSLDTESIEEYCKLVLSKSVYPFDFTKDYKVKYNNNILVIDYQLPSINVVPTLKEEKFIKSKGEIKKTFISNKHHQEIYDDLLYSMIIRTIHEIFEADVVNTIHTIVMNGWITAVNKATGHDKTHCISTINTDKSSFLEINLNNVNSKECFKSLKGISGIKLSDMIPVTPIISFDKSDNRFIEARDVIDNINNGDNIAHMHWEDFEHLVREIFEKEFNQNGSDVRITRSSRDGGVDAIIYDPDPIRGGKIIIQAKRYTNTVGVSAVRDLYGTIQHEGAMKGILITTSNYGSDAFNFAKGKPITLINGSHLLHMIEKHGKKARIDTSAAQ